MLEFHWIIISDTNDILPIFSEGSHQSKHLPAINSRRGEINRPRAPFFAGGKKLRQKKPSITKACLESRHFDKVQRDGEFLL